MAISIRVLKYAFALKIRSYTRSHLPCLTPSDRSAILDFIEAHIEMFLVLMFVDYLVQTVVVLNETLYPGRI